MPAQAGTSQFRKLFFAPQFSHFSAATIDARSLPSTMTSNVFAYVKNHSLGLEITYRYGSQTRQYRADFIVQIDQGNNEVLNLVIEIKGYRREDAKEKKLTMDTYWVSGVNNLRKYGRWAFAELEF